jgi:membrane protease YdiL (CAAX protease family)
MRKYGKIIAAVFSSMLFGLMHQNFTQGIFAFGMGLLMCYVYEKTVRIICTMLLHFLNNAISVLLPFIPKYKNFGRMAEAALGIIALIAVTFILLKKDNRIRLINLLRSAFGALKIKGRECFLTVPMVIYTVFCIGMAIVTAIIMYSGGSL